MKEIKILDETGAFSENKDKARDLRVNVILPAIRAGEEVVVNFRGVRGATQSFIHALISDVMRRHGAEVLEKILFKECNETIKKIIEIVTGYMQDGEES